MLRNRLGWIKLALTLSVISLFATAGFSVTVPTIVPHPYDHDGIYMISWSAATDSTGIASYELQEATTTESVTNLFSDNAEAGLTAWDVVGFTTTTSASYSSTHSFYSGQGNNLNNYMTLKNSITVESDTILSFWTKYNTEDYYDNLYVQISTDKTNWTNLGSFSGNQSTFILKTYSLSLYAGQSIYIRFKYSTDSSVSYDGVYIDNILISNNSGYNFSSISNTLTTTSYDFSGKPNGQYYYRVRAKNNLGSWGSFSNVATVEVGPDIYPPAPPTLSSPSSVICGSGINLSWTAPEDESGISAYEIQESAGSPGFDVIDDAESGLAKWNNSGFLLSTAYHKTGSHSFFTGSGNNLYNTMTLNSPVTIPVGGHLKFWCNYSLATYSDYLYVYISTDGVYWDYLDSLNGYSGGWVQKNYDLSYYYAYTARSVYLRFTYNTGSSVTSSGAYIDDIIVDYEDGGTAPWISLSNSITATSQTITGKSLGSYYYRLRAKDAAGNWSAFSSPVKVMVANSTGVDFAVGESDITLSPDKIAEGDTLTARLVVNNVGTQSAYADVSLYYNSKDADHLIGTNNYIQVPAVGSAETTFSFNTTGMGKNPTLYFVVSSSFSDTADSNLGNNEAVKKAGVISFIRPTLCYPNPFNPTKQTTKFAYRLDQDTWVQIVIFDTSGRIIWRRTFVGGMMGGASGLNEVEWNGITDYSETARNGLYLYKVIDSLSKKVLFGGKVMVLK